MNNYYQSVFSWDALNWRRREMHRYEGGPVGMRIVSNSDPKVKKLDPYSLQKWNWKKDEIVDPFTGIGGLATGQ